MLHFHGTIRVALFPNACRQLEIFEWVKYGGREEEEQLLTYILANSKCLKTATFSLTCMLSFGEQNPIIDKLKNIPRVSTTSQLLFE